MPYVVCNKCDGTGQIEQLIDGTYCDTYKITCEKCFGSGDISVPISARGHLREMWQMEKFEIANRVGAMSKVLPTQFWRKHLHQWFQVSGRHEHQLYIHDLT